MLFLDSEIHHVHVQYDAQLNSTNDTKITVLIWKIFGKF